MSVTRCDEVGDEGAYVKLAIRVVAKGFQLGVQLGVIVTIAIVKSAKWVVPLQQDRCSPEESVIPHVALLWYWAQAMLTLKYWERWWHIIAQWLPMIGLSNQNFSGRAEQDEISRLFPASVHWPQVWGYECWGVLDNYPCHHCLVVAREYYEQCVRTDLSHLICTATSCLPITPEPSDHVRWLSSSWDYCLCYSYCAYCLWQILTALIVVIVSTLLLFYYIYIAH